MLATVTAGATAGAQAREQPPAQVHAALAHATANDAATTSEACPRPSAGGVVEDPPERRSRDGVLELTLTERSSTAPDGFARYCFVDEAGHEAPTLRVRPGDELVLHLVNALPPDAGADTTHGPHAMPMHEHEQVPGDDAARRHPGSAPQDPCQRGAMLPFATNLHFHGMTLPPVCHQDEVLKTTVLPGDPPFEYRMRIPLDEPPGLYWYHPHIHGFSALHVQGGASGALIVEGIERFNPRLQGLAERVLVIRDQPLLQSRANARTSVPAAGPGTIAAGRAAGSANPLVDNDGDALNTGTGGGQPARDLSVNFVPVPWPDYPTPSLALRPGEQQLWRVLNASSVTYLNLAVMTRNGARFRPQWIGVVAIDGVPINAANPKTVALQWRSSIIVSPGARVEFIMVGPPEGTDAVLVTRSVDTGEWGENDPSRQLLNIVSRIDAPQPNAVLPGAGPGAIQPAAAPLPPAPTRPWLGGIDPVRERHLYFSEDPPDPAHPDAPTRFYLTVEGQPPKVFDPADGPDIVAHQGDVEDWVIENRSSEVHAFHIHQLHFQLRDWGGLTANEPFLRDTINVPYWTPAMKGYPSVRVRMDFRDPALVGDFVYHCHLLDHEDAGMMGLIRVEPATQP